MNQSTPGLSTTEHGLRDIGSIARSGDSKTRCALASDTETQSEILYYLAEDPDDEVRRCIAENAQTPRQANLRLARDNSDEVRCVLAEKNSNLFPQTSATERNVMRRAVLDITEVLAADQTKRVRELLSDAIKDFPDVPLHVVQQLATDPYLSVCGPVLENSPVLTEEDLLEIITSAPCRARSAQFRGARTSSKRCRTPSRPATTIVRSPNSWPTRVRKFAKKHSTDWSITRPR